MFRNQTQNEIYDRMKDLAHKEINTEEGSMFHIAVSPMSVELAMLYSNLENVLSLGFAQTTSLEYLKMRAEEHGVFWKEQTKSTGFIEVVGEEGVVIPKGTLFSKSNGVSYESLSEGRIVGGSILIPINGMDFGVLYNTESNTINEMPIEIMGIDRVTNPENVSGGSDSESEEALLSRLLDQVRKPGTSGNKYHYEKWAQEVNGVGDAKCFSLWNGPGTVKLIIVDENMSPASNTIVEDVKHFIEIQRPIGANVTYASADGLEINISVKIKLATGVLLSPISLKFEELLQNYFKNHVAFKCDTEGNPVAVSIGKIGSVLLSINGVLDYYDLKVNGISGNISLSDQQVPVMGAVIVNESK